MSLTKVWKLKLGSMYCTLNMIFSRNSLSSSGVLERRVTYEPCCGRHLYMTA